MKRTILSFIILLLAVSAFAQSKQSGYVKQYNEKLAKTPLGGVELNMYGAASTVSDAKGAFTLNFNTLKAGDKVAYSKIAKAGYVLFNKDKLDQWNISKDNTPFTIIMCQESKFKAIKDNYLKVSSASYARQLKKEEAALEAEYKAGKKTEAAYKKELNELRQYYADQLKNIDTYVDQFSRIDLSELDAQEQAIIDLIQSGDIESAINKYEKLNYIEKYEQEVKEVKQLEAIKSTLDDTKARKLVERDSIFHIVMRQVDAYKMAGGKTNLDKASKLLKECADADTTNLDVVWKYASFLSTQKDFNASIHYYTICLNTPDISVTQEASLHSNLGMQYSNNHDYDMSIEHYNVAIDYLMPLYASSPDDYASDLANIYNNFAILYSDLNDYKMSEKCLLQALENLTSLYERNPDDYRSIIAMIQQNLGKVYDQLNDVTNCEKYYHMALENYEKLSAVTPDAYRYQLATVQNNLGAFHASFYDYENAKKYYLQSLENRKILYESNPDANRPDLAQIQYNLGDLYSSLEDDLMSEEYLLQALANYKLLFESNPNAYMENLARTQLKLGKLYKKLEDYEKSESYCRQALENVKLLYNSNPSFHLTYVTQVQKTLTKVYYAQSKYEEALACMNDALNYTPNDTKLYEQKGSVCLLLGKDQEALDVYHQILKLSPDYFQEFESDFYNALKDKGLIQ